MISLDAPAPPGPRQGEAVYPIKESVMSQPLNRKPRDLAAAVAGGRPLLVRQARRMMRDEDGAEDAAQDAMVAALRHLHEFRGDAQVGTWLYRVGANRSEERR